MTVISYPVPLYQNVPINKEYYAPWKFDITAISIGQTTLVTTYIPHNYVIGQEVRFIIPITFGTRQLNEKKGYVISIPSPTQVLVNIDSSQMDPFILSTAPTKAQILPIGDINSGAQNQTRVNQITYIPGSFINVSP